MEYCLLYSVSFITGLIFGSFANAWVYRWPKKEVSILGRSQCPACKQKIAWYDLFPLFSYIFLRGRCRSCNKKISPYYFIWELVFGLSFLFFAYRYYFPKSAVLSIYFLLIVVAARIDFNVQKLPNLINAALFLIGTVLLFIPRSPLPYTKPGNITSAILSLGLAIIFVILMLLLASLYDERAIGMGDLKLILALSVWVGPFGLAVTIFIASLLGAIYGIVLSLFKEEGLRSRIAFGPFLAVAGLLIPFLVTVVTV